MRNSLISVPDILSGRAPPSPPSPPRSTAAAPPVAPPTTHAHRPPRTTTPPATPPSLVPTSAWAKRAFASLLAAALASLFSKWFFAQAWSGRFVPAEREELATILLVFLSIFVVRSTLDLHLAAQAEAELDRLAASEKAD